jgi:hypothetical protein
MTNPQNCSGQPAGDSLEKLESVLAGCKARKIAAGHVAPTISCMSENIDALRRGQALDAATKRLQAVTASAKAVAAKSTAKASVAALRPSPAAPAMSARDQRRASAKGTLADATDSQLQFVAGHRSAPAADAAAARGELESRGWVIHPNGSFTRSTVRQPRR